MDYNAGYRELGEAMRRWLDDEPEASFPQSAHEKYRNSTYQRCLSSLGEDALKIARERNIQSEDFEYEYLRPIEFFMQGWLSALYPWDAFDPRLWWHHIDPIADAKASKGPDFEKALVEALGGSYLSLPCRSKFVERRLIDCMVAMEFYGFSRELFDPKVAGRVGFVKGNGPAGFLIWRALSVLSVVILFLPFAGLAYFEVISFSVAFIAALVLAALWVLESLWALFRFPMAWRQQLKANQKLTQLLSSMNQIYQQLESNGPISAGYFRECLVKSSDEGVAWPSPIFAILDDILKRDGTF
jgi:hypothetical protein